jgi:hypothetical protein
MYRQDIGVSQLDGDLDFVKDFFFRDSAARLRDLQRDLGSVNRIERPVHVRQWPGRDAADDSIFIQLLPGA